MKFVHKTTVLEPGHTTTFLTKRISAHLYSSVL